MTIRDLSENVRLRLNTECDKEFDEWFERTQGLTFATREPLTPRDIFRYAFSKGVTATLQRVKPDGLKQ